MKPAERIILRYPNGLSSLRKKGTSNRLLKNIITYAWGVKARTTLRARWTINNTKISSTQPLLLVPIMVRNNEISSPHPHSDIKLFSNVSTYQVKPVVTNGRHMMAFGRPTNCLSFYRQKCSYTSDTHAQLPFLSIHS